MEEKQQSKTDAVLRIKVFLKNKLISWAYNLYP